MTDERNELLSLISDLSKDARGFRDRTDYSDRTPIELRAIADAYYLESLQNQYEKACDQHEIPFDWRQVWRMNIAELQHRLSNLQKGLRY